MKNFLFDGDFAKKKSSLAKTRTPSVNEGKATDFFQPLEKFNIFFPMLGSLCDPPEKRASVQIHK